jgi:hypothetical protein
MKHRSLLINLEGLRFGRLKVISRQGISRNNKVLWLCTCDCGASTVKVGELLRSGKTKSCGCFKAELLKRGNVVHGGNPAFNRWFCGYKCGARSRKLSWSLSREFCQQITQLPCHYCDRPPIRTIASGNHSFVFNGLDRIDNSLGYEADNVLPCCWDCNISKSQRSYQEFTCWIKSVYVNLTKKVGFS